MRVISRSQADTQKTYEDCDDSRESQSKVCKGFESSGEILSLDKLRNAFEEYHDSVRHLIQL
jgi:hypothetical protein